MMLMMEMLSRVLPQVKAECIGFAFNWSQKQTKLASLHTRTDKVFVLFICICMFLCLNGMNSTKKLFCRSLTHQHCQGKANKMSSE